jgi:PKD repeat protein
MHPHTERRHIPEGSPPVQRYHASARATFLCTAALVVGLGLYASARAAQVTLRWDYGASGAAGFVLYCGLSSRSYATRFDVGNTDTYVVNLAAGATHFCSVTAYDPAKVESAYSNELTIPIASAPPPAPPSTPPAPKVTFAAQPSSGRAPLDVGFANTTTGEVTSWAWNFGDGSASTLKSPTHRYLQPGTYYVSLTAIGPGGTAAVTSSAPITVSASTGGPRGLVAAYGFNEGTGSSVSDLSGNGNVGTVSGARWSNAGKFGKSLWFNGSSSRITVRDSPSLDLSGAMTLAAWVYPTVAMTDRRVVIVKERSGSNAYHLHASSGTSGRVFTGVFTTTWNRLWSASALPVNRWTHLAATYDGARQRLFVNGVQVASRTQTGAIATSTSPLRIGADGARGEHFLGRIDEVRIYSRALSGSELQTIMNTAVSTQ